MLESGYIRLYRSMLTWEWYNDINTKILFLHLLLTANYEPQKWRGITVERGQRISSFNTLACETGLTIKEIRTCVEHLKSTGEVAHKATSQYGLFTVKNYDKYQIEGTPNGTPEGTPLGIQGAVGGQSKGNNGNKANKASKANKEELPPIPPTENCKTPFDEFWKAYPKKSAKREAQKVFVKLKVSQELLDLMLRAIKQQTQSDQWKKDNGQFIPYPATWLNQRRWEDEQGEVKTDGKFGTFL